MKRTLPRQGAFHENHGVRYCTWAPAHEAVSVLIMNRSEKILRKIRLQKIADGFFKGKDVKGKPGDLYQFSLSAGSPVPDMASNYQPYGVHGPSMVIDHPSYQWKRKTPLPAALHQLVIYELHLGTFSSRGTFLEAITKLPYLVELGVTAIEIMPVADFPGDRNWGYDGVMLYAPARCYGSPDDFKKLIEAAHAHGLKIILDVVYNHLGPDGNYLSHFTPDYFHPNHLTPWGKGLNFDGPRSRAVRSFIIQNAIHWMENYRVDGFRLDSTHSIQDESRKHLIVELAEEIHQRGGIVLAEDERNDASLFGRRGEGQLDGVWVDDFHHSVRVTLKREKLSYFASYRGGVSELRRILDHGWLYRGQYCPHEKERRGTPCRHLPPSKFIYYISNHDQAGNRPLGERLHHLVRPEEYRAVSALLCLAPYTPMIFMGQEWAASSPFLFFTDHAQPLGKKIKEARKKEFALYGHHYPKSMLQQMPDPQWVATFKKSKLDWSELHQDASVSMLRLYRDCLRWRKELTAGNCLERPHWKVRSRNHSILEISFQNKNQERYRFLFYSGKPRKSPGGRETIYRLGSKKNWEVLFSTNEKIYSGRGPIAIDRRRGHIAFRHAEAVLLRDPGNSR